jgi:hypothetical protein
MTTISLRGPGDLLATLPFHLGYHPEDALVVVAMEGNTLAFVQRLDLPEAKDVQDAVGVLMSPLLRHRPDGVFLLGYEAVEDASSLALRVLRESCQDAGIHVLDVLVVRAGRWFAPLCIDGCCPPEGAHLPAPHEVPAVAEFVGMERSALPSRRALDELLAPDPELQAAVARECRRLAPESHRPQGSHRPPTKRGKSTRTSAADRAARRPGQTREAALDIQRLEAALSLWAMVCDVGARRPPLEGLSNEELARLAMSMRDVHFRDALIAWTCPGSLPLTMLPEKLARVMERTLPSPAWSRRGTGTSEGCPSIPAKGSQVYVAAQRFESRLRWLCRAVPEPDLPAMLTLLANFCWWRGEGAAARVALDRAMAIDPDYRLARLLMRMLDLAVRPGEASQGATA